MVVLWFDFYKITFKPFWSEKKNFERKNWRGIRKQIFSQTTFKVSFSCQKLCKPKEKVNCWLMDISYE